MVCGGYKKLNDMGCVSRGRTRETRFVCFILESARGATVERLYSRRYLFLVCTVPVYGRAQPTLSTSVSFLFLASPVVSCLFYLCVSAFTAPLSGLSHASGYARQAGNLRFCPEFLCFLFHKMATLFRATVDGKSGDITVRWCWCCCCCYCCV